MELFLLILCVLVTAADGNSQVVVTEDSDVVLPCSLSSEENLESKLFDWKKDKETDREKRVFMYERGRYSGKDSADQDKQFEGRVSHFPEELKVGNASIKITKTKVSDSGSYSCIFPRLQPSQMFSVQLVVECILKDRRGEKGSVACRKPSTKQIEVTNDQALLQCVVEGAFPKPEVEWRDGSGNILQAEKTKEENSAGRYDIILQTTVTKSDNYSCVATQTEICHQVLDHFLVHLPGSSAGQIVAGIFAFLFFLVAVFLGVWVYLLKKRVSKQNRNALKHDHDSKRTSILRNSGEKDEMSAGHSNSEQPLNGRDESC